MLVVVCINTFLFHSWHNTFSYGTGDFTLGKILEALSGGHWDFVWAQQWFTITDQLNMGVRHLMLDPVYFWDAMRLCHCGTSFPWFDRVINFIEKVWSLVDSIWAGWGELNRLWPNKWMETICSLILCLF